ncbi:MauE/DoxX family redox-associated membrane protein [Phytohabitans kaempferiae]|uniref:MauE/DoxX family redox-associated membrane protein n=1 Tax=Phytohabitans kaempferiae TaxID=1620943 RepID=A0ABV6M9J7_9ACTN
MEYVVVGLRSLIVLVFVVSAASKVRGRRAYAEFVTATGRLSPRRVSVATARRLATGVVAAELATVMLVLVPRTATMGFAVAATLLLAFTGAILLALRRGERAPCRCFGSAEQPLGYPQVARNLLLLAACTLGLAGGQLVVASPSPGGALLAVAAGALAATLVAVFDDLVALFRPP